MKWINNTYQFVSTDELANSGILIRQEQEDLPVGGLLQEGELTEMVRHGNFLSPLERVVLVYRYGLNETKPMFLDDIANFLGRSGERVRQIETDALKKLKWNMDRDNPDCQYP